MVKKILVVGSILLFASSCTFTEKKDFTTLHNKHLGAEAVAMKNTFVSFVQEVQSSMPFSGEVPDYRGRAVSGNLKGSLSVAPFGSASMSADVNSLADPEGSSKFQLLNFLVNLKVMGQNNMQVKAEESSILASIHAPNEIFAFFKGVQISGIPGADQNAIVNFIKQHENKWLKYVVEGGKGQIVSEILQGKLDFLVKHQFLIPVGEGKVDGSKITFDLTVDTQKLIELIDFMAQDLTGKSLSDEEKADIKTNLEKYTILAKVTYDTKNALYMKGEFTANQKDGDTKDAMNIVVERNVGELSVKMNQKETAMELEFKNSKSNTNLTYTLKNGATVLANSAWNFEKENDMFKKIDGDLKMGDASLFSFAFNQDNDTLKGDMKFPTFGELNFSGTKQNKKIVSLGGALNLESHDKVTFSYNTDASKFDFAVDTEVAPPLDQYKSFEMPHASIKVSGTKDNKHLTGLDIHADIEGNKASLSLKNPDSEGYISGVGSISSGGDNNSANIKLLVDDGKFGIAAEKNSGSDAGDPMMMAMGKWKFDIFYTWTVKALKSTIEIPKDATDMKTIVEQLQGSALPSVEDNELL